MGVLGGVPMRPDEIQELMHQMNQPALAHVLPTEDEDARSRPPARQLLLKPSKGVRHGIVPAAAEVLWQPGVT
jgi:hypothetical protein